MPLNPPTQEQIDTLQAAIFAGVLEVEFEGPPKRRIKYQNIEQMQKILAGMVAAQAVATGGGSSSRLAATRKGV